MNTERTPRSDKELWRSLAVEPGAAVAVVSDVEFAAWLEGRLPEAAAARIDAAVAVDPELRRAALELADILGKPLPAAPVRMAVRAQALVGFEVERRIGGGSWLGAFFPFFGPRAAMQRGAMAGLAIMLAAVGFMMGGGLGESYAHEKYASAPARTIVVSPFGSDTTNELSDLFADNT
ncbi:MAG: hypothetical protein ACHQK9_24575 [Reyranellales bacterium]